MEPFYIGKGKDGRKDRLSRNPIHDRISRKHGHAVVVLYDNLTEEEAFFYERETIENLEFDEGYEIPCKNCGEFTGKFSYLTNFTFGGEGVSGYNFSEETKKIISKKCSVSGKKSWENEEKKEKQSETVKKLWEDEEYKEKQSIARRKSWENSERRQKQSKSQSIIMKKRYEDPKEIEKVSGEKSCHAKSIYCKELNIIFSYVKLAREYCKNVLNCKADNIGAVCNGYRKSAGKWNCTKLTWKWVEDVNKEILNNAEYIDSEKYEEIIKAKLNKNK